MPRTRRVERRKHLIIILVALLIALAILLIQAETASALSWPPGEQPGAAEQVTQISDDDYQQALTTERILLLGMLGLVTLTWLYLRWRPSPRAERDPERERPPEHE